MALIPILIGGALVVGGGLAINHSSKRQPLPADIRAQVIAAFKSYNDVTMGKVIQAIQTGAGGKYKGQGDVLQKAIQLGLDAMKTGTTIPADVSALWWAAIQSGDPKTMRTTSEGLRAKYNALASALLDCARILGG